MSEPTETASQKTILHITHLIRARAALLWVVTPEEKRAEKGIARAAAAASSGGGYAFRTWDCVRGIRDLSDNTLVVGDDKILQPDRALDEVRKRRERAVWVMRDLPLFFAAPNVRRAARGLARDLPTDSRKEARTVIILSPSDEVPAELKDSAIVIKWPLPDRAEIGALLDETLVHNEITLSPVERDAAIEAAIGLTSESAAICYAKCLVEHKTIVPSAVAVEKRRVVNAARGVEWTDPDPRGLDAIGGLDNLKSWLIIRKSGFSAEAREFGVPLPKGVFLFGVSGTGKSLTAKAVATAFGCPLLKLDLGATQSKFVGESQQNIRNALAIADTVGLCVLWIDEIEKALAGAQSSNDGGVSADALGTLLGWMQDRKGQSFVIATANDVTKLPPELLRKQRWDELFFIDLPTAAERRAILHVALKKYGRDPGKVITLEAELLRVTERFSGAEIDALVPPALFAAFADGKRELRCADLITAAKETVPLADTAKDKLDHLREWAKGRARRASSGEVTAPNSGAREIDLDEDLDEGFGGPKN